MVDLSNAVKEIKALSEEFKKQNGNSTINISNKDFNLWLVKKLLEQDGRITQVETKQKLMCWFIPISIALAAFFTNLGMNI